MKPWVIKIGGAALVNPAAVENLAKAILLLKEQGEQVVVVHGGGPMINKRLTEKEISWSFNEGQRITTQEMISVIEGALGEVNHMICQVLDSFSIKALGIPGNYQDMFSCKPMNPNLGLVGEIVEVNSHAVEDALLMGFVPVIAPIGVDQEGLSYNINADWGASALAVKLNSKILIYATDQRGILDVHELPYDSLTLAQIQVLIDKGGVTGGMLAKCRTIIKALETGVRKICVTHALELEELIETRFGGTLCVEMSRLDQILKNKENHYVASK